MSHFWQHFLDNDRKSSTGSYLGLQGRKVVIPPSLARARPSLKRERREATGVEVRAIECGSPAEAAGILERDILLALAEKPTSGVDGLQELLFNLPSGIPFPVHILRRGQRLERWVILQENVEVSQNV